jgi:hypothetical protein
MSDARALHSKEPALAPRELRWYGAGETVRVANYLLRDAMVYVSDGQPSDFEASCIDRKLDVGKPANGATIGAGLHAFYAALNPKQRAGYLQWLAAGRVGALDEPAYAFLFFCGLERRLLREHCDQRPILNEVVRLLEIYASHRTLRAQLNGFLVYALAQEWIDAGDDRLFHSALDSSWCDRPDEFLAIALAWHFRKGVPLSDTLALAIARRDPLVRNGATLEEEETLLGPLFKTRYLEQFGGGLVLERSDVHREIGYRPVNASLRTAAAMAESATMPVMIPDFLRFQRPTASLVTLLSRCIDDLPSPNFDSVAEPAGGPNGRIANPSYGKAPATGGAVNVGRSGTPSHDRAPSTGGALNVERIANCQSVVRWMMPLAGLIG